MLSQINSNFKVKQVEKSRISEVNYETLSFGKEFTDHMFVVKYENGKWQQGEILPYGNIKTLPASIIRQKECRCLKFHQNYLWKV